LIATLSLTDEATMTADRVEGVRAWRDEALVRCHRTATFALCSLLYFGALETVDASPYDDCLLENHKGVTSDVASHAIRGSCLPKTEVKVFEDHLSRPEGTAKFVYFPFVQKDALMITIKNGSDYIITGIDTAVYGQKSQKGDLQTTDYFSAMPNIKPGAIPSVSIAVPADSVSARFLPVGQEGGFAHRIEQRTDYHNLWKIHTRAITAAEGIPERVASADRFELPPLQHQAAVMAASFDPKGERVVTTSGDFARIWDAHTGEPIGQPLQHQGEVEAAAFDPTSERRAPWPAAVA
jgi:hypothetical protein